MSENLFGLLSDPSNAGKTALLWKGQQISYADLCESALRIAAELRDRGVKEGDVVTLLFPNAPAFVASYFACWHVGAIANPLNTRLPPSELAALISHAQSRLVVTGPTFAGTAAESIAPLQRDAEQPGDGHLGAPKVAVWKFETEGLCPAPGAYQRRLEMAAGGQRAAALIYTSGTTSAPKGVLLSHRNLLVDARGISSRLGIDDRYRTVCFMPLFHCNALIFSHLSTFCVGGSVVLLPKFSASGLWGEVQRSHAHSFSCPPTVLAMLLDRTPAQQPTPPSLRFVKVGAAPLPEALASSFEKRFGVPLVEGYGMTEGTATTVMHDPRIPRPTGTVGFVLEAQRVRIVDSKGCELGPGQVGEIQIGGETVMLGYYRDPERTASTIVDSWLRTADLGRLETDGYLRLTGRQKELIIRGGENIFPAALDQVLESHPRVRDGAVYGVADPIWGESPVAAVVPKPGLDIAELTRFVRERVADFEMPVDFRLVEEIPRNAVGKIQRHQLQQTHEDTAQFQEEGQPQ